MRHEAWGYLGALLFVASLGFGFLAVYTVARGEDPGTYVNATFAFLGIGVICVVEGVYG